MSDPVKFGLVTCSGVLTGCYVQDVSWGDTCSTAEAMDEQGNIVQIDVYAKKRTFTANATVNGDVAIKSGDKLTIDGHEYTITTATFKEAANAHKTFSVSGTAPFDDDAAGA